MVALLVVALLLVALLVARLRALVVARVVALLPVAVGGDRPVACLPVAVLALVVALLVALLSVLVPLRLGCFGRLLCAVGSNWLNFEVWTRPQILRRARQSWLRLLILLRLPACRLL